MVSKEHKFIEQRLSCLMHPNTRVLNVLMLIDHFDQLTVAKAPIALKNTSMIIFTDIKAFHSADHCPTLTDNQENVMLMPMLPRMESASKTMPMGGGGGA